MKSHNVVADIKNIKLHSSKNNLFLACSYYDQFFFYLRVMKLGKSRLMIGDIDKGKKESIALKCLHLKMWLF